METDTENPNLPETGKSQSAHSFSEFGPSCDYTNLYPNMSINKPLITFHKYSLRIIMGNVTSM